LCVGFYRMSAFQSDHLCAERHYDIIKSRTVADDVVIGSITLATHGVGAMQSAASASEVIILSPEALEFQYYVCVFQIVSVSFQLTVMAI
jgi:hypothetical protein